MRNGEGDSWHCLFTEAGVFLKGFDHDAAMAPSRSPTGKIWPGILEEVPAVFKVCLDEPAFSMEETTFCIWRTSADTSWCKGDVLYPETADPDGSAQLLYILDGKPETYREWATHYYNRSIGLSLVEHIYAHKPLTEQVIRGLNPAVHLAELSDDLNEIGYALAPN
jgi:hypothetical protein